MNGDGSAATAGGHNMTTGLTASTPRQTMVLSFQAVKDAIQGVYEQGGGAHMMSNPGVIGALSNVFDNEARVATLTSDQGAPANSKATALSSVNVLPTLGTIKLVPNRLQPNDKGNAVAFFLDPEYVSLSYLEGYRTIRWPRLDWLRSARSVLTGVCVYTPRRHTACWSTSTQTQK